LSLPESRRRSFGPVHLLLALLAAELVVYRVAVPALQITVAPREPIPPTPAWQAVLGWVGLFLHYFVGCLAIALLLVRAARFGRGTGWSRVRESASAMAAGAVSLIAGFAFIAGEHARTGFALETTLAAAMVIAFLSAVRPVPVADRVFRRMGIPGAAIGLGFVIAPFAIHYYGVISAKFMWPDDAADLSLISGPVTRAGVSALCLAALVSPYCFAPRPFLRSVTRIPPIAVAMVTAALGAVAARMVYPQVAALARHAIGIPLNTEQPDPQLALYILALGTIAWTLTACATAPTSPRRHLGFALGIVVLAGYHEIVWPAYFAVTAVGVFAIADAIPGLSQAERADLPIVAATPPIDDEIWHTWITTLIAGLRAASNHVHALTARGDGELLTTVVHGDVGTRPFRMRIERIAGSVLVVDLRFGRDVRDDEVATFTVETRPTDRDAVHPEPPPAGAQCTLDDAAFDDRFQCRGDRAAMVSALDGDVRTRLTATMDGWLAVWAGEAVRQRIYPGRGAPIDRPIPLSDLALRRVHPEAADRLITSIAVLAEVARQTLPASEPESIPAPNDAKEDVPPPQGESA